MKEWKLNYFGRTEERSIAKKQLAPQRKKKTRNTFPKQANIPYSYIYTSMKILVLVAGMNQPSNADFLANAFIESLKKLPGAEIEKLRLKDISLTHFDLSYYEAGTDQGADFRRLQASVEGAQGIVIATPIWNFSVPAHLKNAIDRMGYFALDATHSVGTMNGKPIYLLYTGGSPAVVWTGLQRRTLSHMAVSLRFFGATIIGTHYEERCTKGRGIFGLVVDKRADSLAEIQSKAGRFGKIVEYYARTGKLPLKQLLLKTIFRWGQQVKRKMGL